MQSDPQRLKQSSIHYIEAIRQGMKALIGPNQLLAERTVIMPMAGKPLLLTKIGLALPAVAALLAGDRRIDRDAHRMPFPIRNDP